MHICHFCRTQWLCSLQKAFQQVRITQMLTQRLNQMHSSAHHLNLLNGVVVYLDCSPKSVHQMFGLCLSASRRGFSKLSWGCMCGSEADFCWIVEIWPEDQTLLQKRADTSSNRPGIKAFSCVNTGTVTACKHTRTLPLPSSLHIPLSILCLCCPANHLNRG